MKRKKLDKAAVAQAFEATAAKTMAARPAVLKPTNKGGRARVLKIVDAEDKDAGKRITAGQWLEQLHRKQQELLGGRAQKEGATVNVQIMEEALARRPVLVLRAPVEPEKVYAMRTPGGTALLMAADPVAVARALQKGDPSLQIAVGEEARRILIEVDPIPMLTPECPLPFRCCRSMGNRLPLDRFSGCRCSRARSLDAAEHASDGERNEAHPPLRAGVGRQGQRSEAVEGGARVFRG